MDVDETGFVAIEEQPDDVEALAVLTDVPDTLVDLVSLHRCEKRTDLEMRRIETELRPLKHLHKATLMQYAKWRRSAKSIIRKRFNEDGFLEQLCAYNRRTGEILGTNSSTNPLTNPQHMRQIFQRCAWTRLFLGGIGSENKVLLGGFTKLRLQNVFFKKSTVVDVNIFVPMRNTDRFHRNDPLLGLHFTGHSDAVAVAGDYPAYKKYAANVDHYLYYAWFRQTLAWLCKIDDGTPAQLRLRFARDQILEDSDRLRAELGEQAGVIDKFIALGAQTKHLHFVTAGALEAENSKFWFDFDK